MTRRWLAIPPKEYFALPAYGSGALRCFAKAGQLVFYHDYIQNPREGSDSDAQRLGRAFHAAMESENGWLDKYARVPDKVEDDEFYEDINSNVKGGKPLVLGEMLNGKVKSHREYMEAHCQKAEREGKEFLSESELLVVFGQIRAVYDNPAIRELLMEKREFNVEATCVYEHESGLSLKALVDLPLFSRNVDFKTTRFRLPVDFIRDAYKRGYDWQAGHYSLVTGKSDFSIISVTNAPPFEANLFEVPRAVINGRKREIDRHCHQLAMLLNDKIVEKDSQGIPLAFHSEGWGASVPLELPEYRGM
jgi:hypothetical protein